MGHILDDLTGGKFSTNKSQQQQSSSDKVYSICIQFDNDEPQELYDNIDIDRRFNLVITGNENKSVFVFTDTKTGKTFKLFAK